jgi:AcrR family transcriptional regulator
MPKIIENLRENLIARTRKTLLEEGYDAVTVRGIAKSCNTAAGTVYNYFPSKDDLIAYAILEDWLAEVARIRHAVETCPDLVAGFKAILDGIAEFNLRYTATFRQSGVALNGPSFAARHHMLRDQIVELMRILEGRFDYRPTVTAEKVMAESLLSGATHDWPDEELIPLLEKLIG